MLVFQVSFEQMSVAKFSLWLIAQERHSLAIFQQFADTGKLFSRFI
jgi:hypothetical protein